MIREIVPFFFQMLDQMGSMLTISASLNTLINTTSRVPNSLFIYFKLTELYRRRLGSRFKRCRVKRVRYDKMTLAFYWKLHFIEGVNNYFKT